MTLVSGSIPSLVNGVSQQVYTQRLASQGEAQVNFVSSLAKGLVRRPPTRHVARLSTEDWSNAAIHMIDRDAAERYVVVISDGDLAVFGLDGAPRAVAFPDGKAYLASASPRAAIRAVTVADHTFLLNAEIAAAMDGALTPSRPAEALVTVRQGNYGRGYRVLIDGVLRASHTTPDGSSAAHAAAIDTSAIATALADQLVAAVAAGPLAGFTITRLDNALHLVKASGDFAIAVEDGYNGDALKLAKGRLQRFSDLPSKGPDGFHVEIVGDQTTAFDNYYVAFDKTAPEDSDGVWRETVAQGVAHRLDAATMPHLLVREADGSFTFRRATWGERAVGDGDSAPAPSFVGRKINDIFFFRNRLGLLADESVVLSRAGEYFDFWPKTVTASLDSDPIDVAGAHRRVSILRRATPHARALLLFSERTQFVLDPGEILTPATASLRVATEFDADLAAEPAAAGRAVYVATARGAFAGVREYVGDRASDLDDAAEITKHTPELIPAGLHRLVAAGGDDTLFALSDGAPSRVFVYRAYWSREEKLQSSWSVWEFQRLEGGAPERVLGLAALGGELALVVQRADGVALERMALDLGLDAEPPTAETPAGEAARLDRRVDETACTIAYDAAADVTTVTAPYAEPGALMAVARGGGLSPAGRVLGHTRLGESALRFSGDLRAERFVIGRPFLSRYRFSPFLLREATDGGAGALTEGRLQILYVAVFFERTGAFRLRVTPKARTAYLYPFTGRLTGADANAIGAAALETGRFKVPVYARNTEVAIEIEADGPGPAAFGSADWEGRFTIRSQRVR